MTTEAASPMPTQTSRLRARHLLSAYSVGAAAGLWANAVIVLALLPIFAIVASRMPPIGLDSWERAVASSLGAVLIGLIYTSGMTWLPRPIVHRSVAFAVVGAPVLAGIHASVLGGSPADIDRALPWIAAAAFGTAILTPIVLRAILWALVRSIGSTVAVPPFTSFLLVVLVLVPVLGNPLVTARVLAGEALAFGVLAAIIVALGFGAWTLGFRPEGERPAWFGAFGVGGLALAAVVGAVAFLGTVALGSS